MSTATTNEVDFSAIVLMYQTKLREFARRITGSREDAEDVVQDALFRAYRSLSAMSLEQRNSLSLRPWLYTITRNASLNLLRKKRRSVAVSLDGLDHGADELTVIDWQTPEEAMLDRASTEEVERTIGTLPVHLSGAARLRFVEGYTTSQIATAFGQPLGTVKSHLHRAVNAMRRLLMKAA